jgi:hypothetical protein
VVSPRNIPSFVDARRRLAIQQNPLPTDREFDLDQGMRSPVARYSFHERYDHISMPPDGYEGANLAFQAGERTEGLRDRDLPSVYPVSFHQQGHR